MNINKKVVEGAAVAVFVMAITVTSVATDQVDTKTTYTQEESYQEEALIGAATKEKATIGVVAAAIGSEAEKENAALTQDQKEENAVSPEKENEEDKNSTPEVKEEKSKKEQSNQDEKEAQEPEKTEESKDASQKEAKQETKEEQSKKEEASKEEQSKEKEASKKEQPEEKKDVEEEQPEKKEASKEEQPEEKKDVKEEQSEEKKDTPEEQQKQGGAAEEEKASEESETPAEAEKQEEAEQPKEDQPASEWTTKLMPDVEEYLNIRGEANEEAEVLGKLRRGDAADIIERGEEWSKISSGSVEGYVKNEFCVFDEAAETMAYELGTVYATASTGGLRVRAQANATEETEIVHVMEEGEKIKVDTQAEVPEGWVAVKTSDTTAFVSAEFVTVELKLGKAISIEEEREAIRRAEEEAAAKQRAAAKASSSQTSGGGTQQREAVAASYDDVTLLGALIQCEAGGECYEGQVAVGAVVMNRLRRGYAGSISGVIYQSGQFSPASSGALARVLANGVSGSCLSAAQEAINGVDNVGGATQFRSASSGQGGIVIGNHVFY